MFWQNLIQMLAPYRFSWLAVVFFAVAAVGYWRGSRRRASGFPRAVAFWLGLALCYSALHTRFDYYAQYMFFIHRGQHLVLHHLGPLLIALANPWPTLAAGLRNGPLKQRFGAVLHSAPVRTLYGVLQHPLVAPVAFVGLIFFWLWPKVHFDAMLSHRLYLLMNWSMLIDGLLFWWLMLDPRDPRRVGTLGFGKRILLLWAVTVPQLVLGAFITLSSPGLYDVYAVCGRAWPIAPETDQVLGGVLTWIPPGMMAVLAMLILLRYMLRRGEADGVQTAGTTGMAGGVK